MIQTVLFDLDGTIIDTNELIIQTFLHVLTEDRPDLTRDDIIHHMGQTLMEQLQMFSGKEDVTELLSAYRAFNHKHHDDLVGEFPHVTAVIEALQRSGIAMGIVTTKIRKTTILGLDRLGITPYMGAIITLDDVEHPKPHPEPVLKAMGLLGAEPGTTLMVGDSPADIGAANAAGVTSVAVGWSLRGAERLKEYQPKHIIHDMRELLSLVGIKRDEV